MSLYHRPDSKIIWCDIEAPNGQRVRRSTGTSDKEKAREFHDRLKAELWDNVKPVTPWIQACKKWLKEAPRSPEEGYMMRRIASVEHLHIGGFQSLIGDYSPSTYNRYVSIINATCVLSGIQIKLKKRRVTTARTRFLSQEEWERLYKELPPHLKDIALFAVTTGLRQSNVTGLTWDRVDLGRGMVWIDAPDMKARKAHGVPLSTQALGLLTKLKESLTSENAIKGNHVFGFRGKPIAKIKLAWQKACVRSGLGMFTENEQGGKVYNGLHFHDLRHTWASWHVQKGTPLQVLKELGGWADIAMVMRYAHLSQEHLRAWV